MNESTDHLIKIETNNYMYTKNTLAVILKNVKPLSDIKSGGHHIHVH